MAVASDPQLGSYGQAAVYVEEGAKVEEETVEKLAKEFGMTKEEIKKAMSQLAKKDLDAKEVEKMVAGTK